MNFYGNLCNLLRDYKLLILFWKIKYKLILKQYNFTQIRNMIILF